MNHDIRNKTDQDRFRKITDTNSKKYVRNTLYNFLGQTLPLVGALISISLVVRNYNVELFGLISLAWLLLGYFSFLDLGLNRATIRGVAVALGRGESESISTIIWSSIIINLVIGCIAGVILFLGTPFLVHRFFTLTPEATIAAQEMFYILAVAVPIVTTGIVLRGALEAVHRFDIVNVIKIVSNTIIFFSPVIIVVGHFSLSCVVTIMVLARLVGAVVYFIYMKRCIPVPLLKPSLNKQTFLFLLQFGGWITVSSIINPILTYLERLLIGSILSVSMLAYYSAPYELVSRIAIIPSSIALTLFPIFSSYEKTDSIQVNREYIYRPYKYLVIFLTPVVIFFIIFSDFILTVWVGSDFSADAGWPMRILAFAFLFNAIAYIPLAAIQGLGYPEIKAKLDIILLIVFILCCVLLIPTLGLIGAAMSKMVIFIIDAAVMTFILNRKINFVNQVERSEFYSLIIPFILIMIFGIVLLFLLIPIVIKLCIFGVGIMVYGLVIWKFCLNDMDKTYIFREFKFTQRLIH
jgi:O-antigen/teichoic acid export membrane protein